METKQILIGLLLINAIFWGLFPHEKHCALVNTFTTKCPPHYLHLLLGVLSFCAAVYLSHKSYIDSMM